MAELRLTKQPCFLHTNLIMTWLLRDSHCPERSNMENNQFFKFYY